MPLQNTQALINKLDGFEAIRQQIVAILVSDRDNQKILATNAALDPADWDFRVYEERSTPYEEVLNYTQDLPLPTPIVNVWFDSDSFSESSSTRAETQKCTATYNVDIYGFGIAQATTEGHTPADRDAAFSAHRVTRLARNILLASHNAYLQLPRGTAWDRKIDSRQSYQPRLDQRPVVEVVAVRMRFSVSFNEVSPQYEGVPLQQLVATVHRAEDGEVYFEAQYDYSTN